jgi:protein-S-isoprenylcysteine O-methyltransferase Ste14
MDPSNLPTHHPPEDDSNQRIGNVSLLELGENLFQWRHYTIIPAMMIVLLFSATTPRSATVGTILIMLGTLARIYTVAFLAEDSSDGHLHDQLITSGPFALVRNPLYISNLIITLGVAFYSGAIVVGILVLGFFVFQYHCISRYEEQTLLAKFGDEYQRYMERVPAWVPLRVPVSDDFPIPPSFSAAFIAEKKSIGVVSVILFLLMLAAR